MPGNSTTGNLKGYSRDPLSDCVLMGVLFSLDNREQKEGVMDTIETIIRQINDCSTAIDLEKIVGDYLLSIAEADTARGETYLETAQRLGGDEVLTRAHEKIITLDSGWLDD
jgi:hypothetical protein